MTVTGLTSRLRQYLSKASFSHGADRQSALRCLNEIDQLEKKRQFNPGSPAQAKFMEVPTVADNSAWGPAGNGKTFELPITIAKATGVKLPPYVPYHDYLPLFDKGYAIGHNDALRKVADLNPVNASWNPADQPPIGAEGCWTTPVIVVTNLGNVHMISYFNTKYEEVGCWQRPCAFVKGEEVTLWQPMPEYK